MPKWWAIVVSAAIFGIVHGNPIQFIYATALGILLGWIYTKFNSILIPMLCHLVFNLTSQLSGYLDTESELVATILGLVVYLSIPIFIFSIVYINITKFNDKKVEINTAQPFVPYQYGNQYGQNTNMFGVAPGQSIFGPMDRKEYKEDVIEQLKIDIENYDKNNNSEE